MEIVRVMYGVRCLPALSFLIMDKPRSNLHGDGGTQTLRRP